jgi:hypothetical protein
LLSAATAEFTRLTDLVDAMPEADRSLSGPCGDWSVKDLFAHLDAWHEMFLGWEAAGSAGQTPAMPARGYSWSDTPAINAEIHARTASDAWDEVAGRLTTSHRRVLDVIGGYADDDLFTKKRYAWTGSTSVGSYAVSATSSHYAWARKLIAPWVKRRSA